MHLTGNKIRKILYFNEFVTFSGSLIYTATGYNDVNVGVIIQAPIMCVQNSCHTQIGTQEFWICAKVFQSAADAFKHKFVNKPLVVESR
jgi:hypothetical protein